MPTKFAIGNTVYCKIRGNSIILARDENFETQLPFDIIGYDKINVKYILLVPKYFNIKNSWNIIEEHLGKLHIDHNRLDEKAISVYEDKIVRVKVKRTNLDGMYCDHCKEFFPMAEPNQLDGTLRCWSCRQDAFR